MSDESASFFIPPELCNGYQLLFLTAVYGYCLFQGSSLISDGSELLLLVPSVAGMVGSIVLPILGAVPDSLMILFSGTGDKAQEKLGVGVGALAGSTIMLLTFPWFLSIFGGRVNLDPQTGLPIYSRPASFDPIREGRAWEKLYPANWLSLRGTGVASTRHVRTNAIFMMGSALLYLVIQLPALIITPDSLTTFALVGTIACLAMFVLYIWDQYKASKASDSVVEEKVIDARVGAIRAGEMSLLGAVQHLLNQSSIRRSLGRPLMDIPSSDMRQLRSTLSRFYKVYEDQGSDKQIGIEEFKVIMRDLRCDSMALVEMQNLFYRADKNSSGNIDFEEFVHLIIVLIRDYNHLMDPSKVYHRSGSFTDLDDIGQNPPKLLDDSRSVEEGEADSAELEEDEEMPQDLANLTPEQQQRRIKLRAAWMMGCGALLVLIFSDPAVEVLTEISKRCDVNPFFISFILAPLASNASEVIAAYNYSQRKTRKTMQVALTTLEGAACLNNTLCLSIFLGIIYFRQLQWTFTAEVIAILLVQFTVGYMAARKHAFRLLDGLVVLSMYPISLIVVEVLKLSGVQ